jgi:two-component system, chemotaxis family, chemotaxis protein CheY
MSMVLTDWNMPQMDGLELVKRLRADQRFASVLVMMVTIETRTDQMLAVLDAGANEYIMKPFTQEMIAHQLRLMGALQ